MKDEKQPQILRLRPLRRTSLRMTDQLVRMTGQLFRMTDQLFNKFQIKDARSC